MANLERLRIASDFALAEAIRLHSESEVFLVESIVEANRLKKIELGLDPEHTGEGENISLQVDHSYPGAPVADLSGQRPPDYTPLPTPILPVEYRPNK